MKPAHSIPEYLRVIRNGIRAEFKDGRPKNVIVVGAGMAGLVAASELKRAGHHPLVLEGQQRIGGRVHTLRHPFTEIQPLILRYSIVKRADCTHRDT